MGRVVECSACDAVRCDRRQCVCVCVCVCVPITLASPFELKTKVYKND